MDFLRWLFNPNVPLADRVMWGIPFALGVLFVAGLLIYIVPQWLRGFRALFRGISGTAGELRQARDAFNRFGSANALLEEQKRLHPERFVAGRRPGEQIPISASVRAAVLREFPGAKKMKGCRGAEDEKDLDVTFFEGDLYRCLTFHPDGTLAEIDEDVAIDDVPIREAVKKAHPEGADIEVTRIRRGSDEEYETTSGDGERLIRFDRSGRIIE